MRGDNSTEILLYPLVLLFGKSIGWGWNAVDRFCWILSFLVMAFPKCEVKRGSQSLMILIGRPNHLYTWLRYNWAIPGLEIFVVQGRKIAALEHPWSTIVRMVLKPHLLGSPVIRSIAMVWNGRVCGSVGIQYVGTCRLWVCTFIC